MEGREEELLVLYHRVRSKPEGFVGFFLWEGDGVGEEPVHKGQHTRFALVHKLYSSVQEEGRLPVYISQKKILNVFFDAFSMMYEFCLNNFFI